MTASQMDKIRMRIKSRREELGFSLQDLASKTDMSKSTLQRYETGSIKNLPLDKLEVLAHALEVSPSYLMGWEEPPGSHVPETIAAHLDGVEFSETDLEDITEFIDFVKQRRKRDD